ncbi:LacI family DNA-binding transcriptional regulator [Siminovitchia sp. 179-K 8D1 HS]|uniref:LacI family DNA-binding transcriptional regulator n=1 Tax=Siminovitchia sp. 179-K 8D1 HS TaxID=3142385 RepID=UPI0039A00667
MKKATIADVAKRANVSKSTVSQYLNKRYEYMGEETRKKIEKAIQELNYRPNFMARSLKQKSTFTIGVIVANIIHGFSTKIVNGLEAEFDKKGFHMIICNSADEPSKEKKHIETLLERQVDGFIIFPTGKNEVLYRTLTMQNIPIVFIDRFIEELDIPSVLLDNMKAMEMAVSSFNVHPLAVITTSLDLQITPRVERLEGFRLALQKRNIRVQEEYIRHGRLKELPQIFNELFSLAAPPKGIIATNDRVSQELMLYVKKHHIRVPDELQIVVIDEMPYTEFMTPPLTAIEQPSDLMAKQAAALLFEKIEMGTFKETKKLYRFEPIFLKRDSTLL